jgi:hypothetical protein
MLTRSQIVQYATAALTAANTMAGTRIWAPRDWSTNAADYPGILVQCFRTRKESRAKGSQLPQFLATPILTVIGRLQVAGADETAAATATDQLEAFEWQIEQAILTNQSLLQNIRRFSFVDSDGGVTANGRYHIGEIQINFGLEFEVDIDPFTQAPASVPPIAVPLEEVKVTYEMPDGTTEPGVDITLPQ